MKVKILGINGTWREVANAANTTINKEAGSKEISSNWKRKMLLCEHSPIRLIHIKAIFTHLPSWVSVHFVRHKFGIEHWVSTQRSDRTNIDRNKLPQDSLVNHQFEANAQAIINISQKRLCLCAATETRLAWRLFLDELYEFEPELVSVCVPSCIYRGFCPEFKSCNFSESSMFKTMREDYVKKDS